MTSKDGLFSRSGIDISVRGLSKNYRVGDVSYPALREIDCEIKKGAVTIIQGPSGCGKSTFLNMLGGVDRPDTGLLQVGDKELTQQMTEGNLSEYRLLDVGFVFQAFNLIPGLTAQENLALPMTVAGKKRAERVERAQALLELMGMREKESKRPDELSGGEQQRVSISLALVNDPLLILADEPTGNLDSDNAMIVADLLCSLAHDYEKTVIIATHDPAVAAKGDLVFQMHDGALLTGPSV